MSGGRGLSSVGAYPLSGVGDDMDRFDPKKPFALILLNLGGPDTIAAIQPFLRNLFSDKEIIRLPAQPLLSWIISRGRAKKVAPRYEAIGGGSPILKLTEEQAAGLEASLNARGYDCRIYIGMRYWHPFIEAAVSQALADGYKQILAFPLFPHYSRTTTGSCFSALDRAIARSGSRPVVKKIESWCDDSDYLDALAAQVQKGLDKFEPPIRPGLKVLFSAHSLPQEFVDRGDPYPADLKKTIGGLLARLGKLDYILAFQSRSGPVKWMEPQTDKVIEELARSGAKNLLVVPISFVGDHIETLYEIDRMYKELALSGGIVNFVRSPSLNSEKNFIDALASIAERALESD